MKFNRINDMEFSCTVLSVGPLAAKKLASGPAPNLSDHLI